MDGFQTYQTYLSLKLHFSKESYDFFKFNGKSKSKIESFEKRKDKYFFKKLSSKFDDNTIIEYFVSLFVNDKTFWIGNILDKDSEFIYKEWKKKIQSLFYVFENDIDKLCIDYNNFDNWFKIKYTYPPIIKEYLASNINIETLVILNQILNYVDDIDKKISDLLIWPDIKRKIIKYSPFLKIETAKYKQLIRKKII